MRRPSQRHKRVSAPHKAVKSAVSPLAVG